MCFYKIKIDGGLHIDGNDRPNKEGEEKGKQNGKSRKNDDTMGQLESKRKGKRRNVNRHFGLLINTNEIKQYLFRIETLFFRFGVSFLSHTKSTNNNKRKIVISMMMMKICIHSDET